MTQNATIGINLQPQGAPVRVLVVDDSAIVRGLIARQLGADPAIVVAATADNGQTALHQLASHPVDVVVLDIEMPVMDGLTVLPLIVERHPGVKVVIASTLSRRNAEISLRALQLGASDYLAKPEGALGGAEDFKRELIAKIKALAPRACAPASAVQTAAVPLRRPPPAAAWSTPKVLAIGASTGGPPALLRLFESLRGVVKQPIFITQHMPPVFTSLFAEQLQRAGERPCAEGKDGESIQPGHCYVAPGGYHMVVEASAAGPVIRLNQDDRENFCRPAVDPMFRSLSRVYGSGVLGLIMTGMGADGAKGCQALASGGGRFVVQDEASSVVWGMPGAAAATGLAEKVLPLAEIGPWLRQILETR